MTLTGIANLAFIVLLFSPGCKNSTASMFVQRHTPQQNVNIPHLKALIQWIF